MAIFAFCKLFTLHDIDFLLLHGRLAPEKLHDVLFSILTICMTYCIAVFPLNISCFNEKSNETQNILINKKKANLKFN